MASTSTLSSALRSILVICILIMGFTAFANSPPDSHVIRVSKNAAGYQAPYHYGSIQSAISELPTELTTPTVILIYPGEYEEYVTIDRRNVSLVGVESGAVVLSGNSTTSTLRITLPAGSPGDVNVIEGIRVTHDGTNGGVPVYISSINASGGLVHDLLIRGCQIESAAGNAVSWTAAGSSILADCDLKGVGSVIDSSAVPTGSKLAIRDSRIALTSSSSGEAAISADETIDAREVVFSVSNAGTHSNLTAFSGATAATVTVSVGTVLNGMTWGDGVTFLNVDAGHESNLNADYLDSLDSTQFLRSDVADTATGAITFSGELLSPSTGANSFKAGTGATAAGSYSIALGRYSLVSSGADNTIAMGRNSAVTGYQGNAIGYNSSAAARSNALGSGALATGADSVAVGHSAEATTLRAIAVGFDATASVGSAIAVGNQAQATQTNSLAIGSGATAAGNRSVSMGDSSTASGDYGIALGWTSKALHNNSFAIGQGVETTMNNEIRLGKTTHHVSIPGDLGLGIVDPVEKLEVYNGAISIGADAYSTPTAQMGRAKFFVNQDKDSPSVTAMWVIDSAGNTTQLSSHAVPKGDGPSRSSRSAFVSSFDDPNVTLPWSFHHANRLTGDAAVVDMARMVQWVEQQMQDEDSSARLVYPYQLPEDKMITREDWEVQAILEAVERELQNAPWVLVPLEAGNRIPTEAYETIEEYVDIDVEETYIDYVIESQTMTVVSVEKTRTVSQRVPTGDFVNQLRPNYILRDGQLYRQRTIDDLDLSEVSIPELPDWIRSRIGSE